MMNESKYMLARLAVSLMIPLIIVTLGGIIVYRSADAFFFPELSQTGSESNSPAVIYYGITFVVALMLFILKRGYIGYEFVVIGIMSLVYSLSLQKMMPLLPKPLQVYIVPILVFFFLLWLLVKFIFLNRHFRPFRLIIFAIGGGAAYAVSFWIQYLLLKLPTGQNFWQARFVSGLMLFLILGFSLSITELILMKMEPKPVMNDIETDDEEQGNSDKDEEDR